MVRHGWDSRHRGRRAARPERYPRADALRGAELLDRRLHERLCAGILVWLRRIRRVDRLCVQPVAVRTAADGPFPEPDGARISAGRPLILDAGHRARYPTPWSNA